MRRVCSISTAANGRELRLWALRRVELVGGERVGRCPAEDARGCSRRRARVRHGPLRRARRCRSRRSRPTARTALLARLGIVAVVDHAPLDVSLHVLRVRASCCVRYCLPDLERSSRVSSSTFSFVARVRIDAGLVHRRSRRSSRAGDADAGEMDIADRRLVRDAHRAVGVDLARERAVHAVIGRVGAVARRRRARRVGGGGCRAASRWPRRLPRTHRSAFQPSCQLLPRMPHELRRAVVRRRRPRNRTLYIPLTDDRTAAPLGSRALGCGRLIIPLVRAVPGQRAER